MIIFDNVSTGAWLTYEMSTGQPSTEQPSILIAMTKEE